MDEPKSLSEKTLPKGISGKCAEIIKYLFPRQNDALQTLTKSTIPVNLSMEQIATLSETMPKIFAGLFGYDKGFTEKTADTSDMTRFAEDVAERILNPNKNFDDVSLSIGLGGATTIPNIRIASYIVPALSSLDALYKLNTDGKIKGMPRLTVFKADHLSIRVNKFNAERVHVVSQLTFAFLRTFVERFFPHLAQYVSFETDDAITESKEEVLLAKITSYAAWLHENHAAHPAVVQLEQMGEKHGGENGKKEALLYAAAHVFYQGSLSKGSPIQNLECPAVLITHGGQPQHVFNDISRLIIDEEKRRGFDVTPTIGLITRVGKRPPYYAARDGDIPLGTELAGHTDPIDKTTATDYQTLYEAVPKESFEIFVSDFNRAHASLINELAVEN